MEPGAEAGVIPDRLVSWLVRRTKPCRPIASPLRTTVVSLEVQCGSSYARHRGQARRIGSSTGLHLMMLGAQSHKKSLWVRESKAH